MYFTYFESFITLVGHVMCLKRLITVLIRAVSFVKMGMSVPSLHISVY